MHKRGTETEESEAGNEEKEKNKEKKESFFIRHKGAVAATALMGTIIGAGILGIPYVVAKAGFLYGFILIFLLGIAFLYLNLFLGEVVLRTKEQRQLPGYANQYLGIWGKRLMTFSLFVGLYGALTAYLIGEGATLHAIFKVGVPLYYTLGFFAVVAYIIYRGVKAAGKAELILISLLFVVVAAIGIFSFRDLQFSRLATSNLKHLFLPYGVILFAYMGLPAIPEMQEIIGHDKKLLKRAILLGAVLPIILYAVFTFFIVGLVGLDQFELLQPNERIATVALSMYTEPLLGILANLLAMLSMFTSFLTIGIALTEVYQYDYGLSRGKALLLTLSLPLAVAGFNLTTFLSALAITGAVGGGLDGILVVLMYWKAKVRGDRMPEYSLPPHFLLGTLLMVLFALGIAYQLWVSFG